MRGLLIGAGVCLALTGAVGSRGRLGCLAARLLEAGLIVGLGMGF